MHALFFIIVNYLSKQNFFQFVKIKILKIHTEQILWKFKISTKNLILLWPDVCQNRNGFSKIFIFKKSLLNKKISEIWKVVKKNFGGQIPKWWVMRSLGTFVKKFLHETQTEEMRLKFFLKASFLKGWTIKSVVLADCGRLSWKIKIMMARYEVQLSILHTRTPSRLEIPTFLLNNFSI